MHGSRCSLSALILGLSLALVSSCSSDHFIARDYSKPLNKGANSAATDTVYFLLDNSGSMGERYKDREKITTAKAVLYRFNRVFPEHMNVGMRSFGINFLGFETTDLDYGITEFCCWDFGAAVRNIYSPKGVGNMEAALRAAGDDLKGLKGRIALVVISDGESSVGNPVAAASDLKALLGPRLCIHSIQLGNDREGGQILSRIADVSDCGKAVKAEMLETQDRVMALYEKIFPAMKTSGHKADKTAPVESRKNVLSAQSQTAEKHRKKSVSRGVFLRLLIRFESGKADINPIYAGEIKKVADFMKQYPEIKVAIEGHTDSRGSISFNMWLSRERARAVMTELIETYGIDSSRLKAVGYGPRRPVAKNTTEKGRERNRRVEARRISG
jgi:OOP family OmpA-OmpF porin